MTCSKVKKQLSCYLERICGADEVTRIARHIEACPDCATELRELQSVREMLRSLRGERHEPVSLAEVKTAIFEYTTHAHMVPGLKQKLFGRQMYFRRKIGLVATVLSLITFGLIWNSTRSVEAPTVQNIKSSDEMFFILQEHELTADQNVLNNRTLGSIMVNYNE